MRRCDGCSLIGSTSCGRVVAKKSISGACYIKVVDGRCNKKLKTNADIMIEKELDRIINECKKQGGK